MTGKKDGSRLTVALGFHGKCTGGGLSELYSSNVETKPVVRVRDGRFDATLTGVSRNLGAGRSGHFEWTFTGRFTKRDVAVATVSGTARDPQGWEDHLALQDAQARLGAARPYRLRR